MLKTLALAAALMLTAGTTLAQDAIKPAPAKDVKEEKSSTLGVGDRAPELKVEKFVKGTPVTGFEKGKVYVVEFWATWCGPCIAAFPHLSAMQAEHKDQVTFIGVNIWEDMRGTEYSDKTPAMIADFVKDQGDRMSYTVAYDGATRAMDKAYMKAAGRNGIPCAFVVDQQGTIAWIGHPGQMEPVLEEVIAGSWDTKTGPEKLNQAMRAFRNAGRAMQDDAKAGVEAWEKAEKDFPRVAKTMVGQKFQLFLRAEQWDAAYAAGGQLVDKAIRQKNPQDLNEVAWTIVDPENDFSNRNVELAMKAAAKANEFSGDKDPMILDTLARVYFVKGDKAKAVETQEKAVKLAKESSNEQMKEMVNQLELSLEEFKKGSK